MSPLQSYNIFLFMCPLIFGVIVILHGVVWIYNHIDTQFATISLCSFQMPVTLILSRSLDTLAYPTTVLVEHILPLRLSIWLSQFLWRLSIRISFIRCTNRWTFLDTNYLLVVCSVGKRVRWLYATIETYPKRGVLFYGFWTHRNSSHHKKIIA